MDDCENVGPVSDGSVKSITNFFKPVNNSTIKPKVLTEKTKNEKVELTYEEFLQSLRDKTKEKEETLDEGDQRSNKEEIEPEEESVNELPAASNSITKFFKKLDPLKSVENKCSGNNSTEVKVSAVIHTDIDQKVCQVIKKVTSPKKKSKMKKHESNVALKENDVDLTITHIETLTVKEEVKSKKNANSVGVKTALEERDSPEEKCRTTKPVFDIFNQRKSQVKSGKIEKELGPDGRVDDGLEPKQATPTKVNSTTVTPTTVSSTVATPTAVNPTLTPPTTSMSSVKMPTVTPLTVTPPLVIMSSGSDVDESKVLMKPGAAKKCQSTLNFGRKKKQDAPQKIDESSSLTLDPKNKEAQRIKGVTGEQSKEGDGTCDQSDAKEGLETFKAEIIKTPKTHRGRSPIKLRLHRQRRVNMDYDLLTPRSKKAHELKQQKAQELLNRAKGRSIERKKKKYSREPKKEPKMKLDKEDPVKLKPSEKRRGKGLSRIEKEEELEVILLDEDEETVGEDDKGGVKRVKGYGEEQGRSQRRSQRVSARVAQQALVEYQKSLKESTDCESTKLKSHKNKSTPKRKGAATIEAINGGEGKKTTCKAKPVKLASIFLKKGAEVADSEGVEVVDSEGAEGKCLTKEQKAFLMSSLPQEIQKQKDTASQQQQSLSYPPIPNPNHVLQSDGWSHDQRPSITSLPLRSDRVTTVEVSCGERSRLCDINQTRLPTLADYTIPDLPSPAPALSKDMIGQLLEEISALNPTFPAKKLYGMLTTRQLQEEGNLLEDDRGSHLGEKVVDLVTPEESRGAGSKKRKLQTDQPKRRSKRTKTTAGRNDVGGEQEQLTEEKPDFEVEKEESRENGVMWTERYAPKSTGQVIGHVKALRRLKEWLNKWKRINDADAKRLKRRSELSDFDEDFDDFVPSSEGSDEEGSGGACPINTVLLTGNHGIGKTSIVYALAQELGYQVFEVNATAKRNGRQILSQLQEATQSHQVIRDPTQHTESKPVSQSKNPPSNSSTSFANFFMKKPKTENKEKKKGRKKMKENLKDPEGESHQNGGAIVKKKLKLKSTSIILFDEVDVIFEEDKGLWSAIQTFMSTTKRPIILTATTTTTIPLMAEGKMECITLHTPHYGHISSYLQLLCLLNNQRTDYHDLLDIVNHYHGDIRHCILQVQYWILSGANAAQKEMNLVRREGRKRGTRHLSALMSDDENSLPQPTREGDSDGCSTPVRSSFRLKSRLILDDSSRDSFVNSPLKSAAPLETTPHKDNPSATTLAAQPPPVSWLAAYLDQQIIPTMQSYHYSSLVQMFQSHDDDSHDSLIDMNSQLRSQGHEVIYNNLCHLIDLPKCNLPSQSKCLGGFIPEYGVIKRRRAKLFCDIYDSEGDDEREEKGGEEEKGGVTEEEGRGMGGEDKQQDGRRRCVSAVCVQSLKSLSEYYNTLSYTDSYMKYTDGHTDEWGLHRSGMPSDLTDSTVKVDTTRWWKHRYRHDLLAQVEVESLKKLNLSLKGIQSSVSVKEPLVLKAISMPVPQGERSGESLRGHLRLSTVTSHQIRLNSARRKCQENIIEQICPLMRTKSRSLHLDYIPALITICKSEQYRQAHNNKRRFFHYLDSINVPLKQRSIDVLCTSYTS